MEQNGTCKKLVGTFGKPPGMCRKWNVSEIFSESIKYDLEYNPSGKLAVQPSYPGVKSGVDFF